MVVTAALILIPLFVILTVAWLYSKGYGLWGKWEMEHRCNTPYLYSMRADAAEAGDAWKCYRCKKVYLISATSTSGSRMWVKTEYQSKNRIAELERELGVGE